MAKDKKATVAPPPPPGGCHHYVERKRRYCKMLVKEGAEWCGEHSQESVRIPCPYDPGHTCPADNVDKHLVICNSRPPDNVPPYMVPGINVRCDREQGEMLSIPGLPDEDLIAVIEKVQSTFRNIVSVGDIEQLQHPSMKEELENKEYGPNILKHHVQNSSLLQHLTVSSLLSDDTTFIEFGSGRGALSYWITKAVNNPGTCDLLLVDKASPRHKLDTRLKFEAGDNNITVSRLRLDIGDLDLGGAVSPFGHNNIVGVSKHLCGAATDLTLRCLANTVPHGQLKGVMIALCCHHRCEWAQYVGQQFLLDNGFRREQFRVLTSMSSWATCGFGKSKIAGREEEEHDDSGVDIHPNDRYTRLGLDDAKRAEIGRKTKRVLDWGRVKYCEEKLSEFSAEIKHYVSPDVSLENVILLCKPKL